MRLDLYLVEHKHCPSRAKAQELINAGGVQVMKNRQWQTVTSPSFRVTENSQVKIVKSDILKYVARSGLKLQYAMNDLSISVKNAVVLDIGQSTGGFTDCVLQAGARKVVGVDVGHNQLSEKLKQDPRVEYYEGVNAKGLLTCSISTEKNFLATYAQSFDLCCIDVSFISLDHIFDQVGPLLKSDGCLLALVKPQFEVGQSYLKNGVVSDPKVYPSLQIKIQSLLRQQGFSILNYISSQLPGKQGNIEFFVFAQKK